MAGRFCGPLFVAAEGSPLSSRKSLAQNRKALNSKRYAQALFEYFKISDFLEDFSLC